MSSAPPPASDAADAAGATGSTARLFNFETMSGVFPGTRTQVYQRVRLVANRGEPPRWAQLLWYADPAACVLLPLDMQLGRAAPEPLLRLEEPPGPGLVAHLNDGLAAHGLRLATCGACIHWAPGAGATHDGLPLGECRLRRPHAAHLPQALAGQSALALDCPHWADAGARAGPAAPADALPPAPLPRAAVISDSKKPWRTRLALRLRRALAPPPLPPPPLEALVERSGVGAGTEACFACHGRIANLGALAVETPEGDKQTFSLWRCRLCFTLYLSDWIDRWERVDSLETEETIYRIAPAEAADLLTLIAGVAGGDHPGQRHQRAAERAWVLNQLERRPILSHLIKQGR